MRRAAAMNALMLTALLFSGCTSVPGQNLFGLAKSGGNASADGGFGSDSAADSARSASSASRDGLANTAGLAVVDISLNSPADRISESQYPAITYIGQANKSLLGSQRAAAAAQKHRTPRAKPPPHDFIVKPVATGWLTSGHGYRLSPLGTSKPRIHKGIDYAAPRGTEVYAAGAGIVERIYRSSSYGNYIRIRHANGYATAYAHLDSYAKGIKVGTTVKPWQIIGTVGSTGRSTGPHLHFELIHKGRFVDPLQNRVKTELARTDTSNGTTISQN